MRSELLAYPCVQKLPDSLFGSVPTTWRPVRLKFVMPNVTVGIVITPSKYYVDDGVPAIRSLNVKNGRLTDDDLVFFSDEDNRKLSKTRIYRGDVVIVRTGQTGVCAVVDGRFDGANCIDLIIVRQSRHMRSRFLQYFLASSEAEAEIAVSSNGAIQQHFNIGLVREIRLLLPSLTDQDAIVAFLDRETVKIDRLIEVRRKQVERLHEERAAVVDHAVTKGVDPNAPMKPSGHPWLEEIPSHWETIRLKFTAKINPGKSDSLHDANSVDEVVFLPMECVSTDGTVDQSNRERVCDLWKGFTYFARGDVLVAKITPCFENGKGALVADLETEIGFGTTEFHVIRAGKRLLKPFLYLITISSRFRGIGERFMTGAAGQQRVSEQFIEDFPIALPPASEQQAIVEHVKRERTKTDSLIAKYGRELELLAEYRASLISHVVTGKVDVRGVAPPAETQALEAL
jgi:type I restriction enzyme S subunit